MAAFAAVPNALVNNPDDNNGITLHIQRDETDIPLAPWPNNFADFDVVKAVRFGTAAERASGNWANIKAAKDLTYRYCIFADTYGGTTSSGLSEFPGNDFMVTLGGWAPAGGDPNQQAGTFMHELGHNLGLSHGGDQQDPTDHRYNWKPNYHSIMNYTWQFPIELPAGAVTPMLRAYHNSWILDYSREAFPNLNEANLDEATGIGGHAGHVVPVGPSGPPLPEELRGVLVNENGPVDWNRNGNTNDAGVRADINFLGDVNGDGVIDARDESPDDILRGYCDWPHLRYWLCGHPNFQDGVHIETTVHNEMTYEMFIELSRIGCAGWDINCDGGVDFNDFAILADAWQLKGSGLPGDINGDETVNLPDLKQLVEHWLEGK